MERPILSIIPKDKEQAMLLYYLQHQEEQKKKRGVPQELTFLAAKSKIPNIISKSWINVEPDSAS